MADTKHTPAHATPAAKGGKRTRAEDVAHRLEARGITKETMRAKLRSASPRDLQILKLSLGFDADESAWIANGAAPLRAPEIAARVGCTPEVVRAVRKAFGIIEGTAARMHEGAFDVSEVVDLDDEDSTGAEFLDGFGIRDKASQIDSAVVLESPREFKDRQTAREWLRSVGEDPDAVEHGERREFAGHTAQTLRAAHAAASLMLDARQTLVDAEHGTLTAAAMDEWFEQLPHALQVVGADAADLLVSVDVCIEHGAMMCKDNQPGFRRVHLTAAQVLERVELIASPREALPAPAVRVLPSPKRCRNGGLSLSDVLARVERVEASLRTRVDVPTSGTKAPPYVSDREPLGIWPVLREVERLEAGLRNKVDVPVRAF